MKCNILNQELNETLFKGDGEKTMMIEPDWFGTVEAVILLRVICLERGFSDRLNRFLPSLWKKK